MKKVSLILFVWLKRHVASHYFYIFQRFNTNFSEVSESSEGCGSGSSGKIFSEQNNNVRFSQKDLYNLYDHACICQAYKEARSNEKSYFYLYKMKSFLRQIRAVFGLMHLWSIDCCLELVEYCLSKSKMYENPSTWHAKEELEQYAEIHFSLQGILEKKKQELIAYKELTMCARKTLAKYYEHQQIQDEVGFYHDKQINSAVNDMSLNTSVSGGMVEMSDEMFVLTRIKKVNEQIVVQNVVFC